MGFSRFITLYNIIGLLNIFLDVTPKPLNTIYDGFMVYDHGFTIGL